MYSMRCFVRTGLEHADGGMVKDTKEADIELSAGASGEVVACLKEWNEPDVAWRENQDKDGTLRITLRGDATVYEERVEVREVHG